MRKFQFTAAAACALFCLLSCRQGFTGDPRLYNSHDSSFYVSDIYLHDKELQPEELDRFEEAADWNCIDYIFDGNRFDSEWVLPHLEFDIDNIPVCTFGARQPGWKISHRLTSEYSYDASDEGNKTYNPLFPNGLSFSSMTIYQYRGKNPLAVPGCGYNTSDRMERFRFYRMEGQAVVDLDQFVIAVDTYSKFVFAYGAITDYTSFGSQRIPTEYEPVERYIEGGRPFYEYDPIGYIDESGKFIRYKRYEEDMRAAEAVNFLPSIHASYTEMAKRETGGEGRSPYYPLPYDQ